MGYRGITIGLSHINLGGWGGEDDSLPWLYPAKEFSGREGKRVS